METPSLPVIQPEKQQQKSLKAVPEGKEKISLGSRGDVQYIAFHQL